MILNDWNPTASKNLLHLKKHKKYCKEEEKLKLVIVYMEKQSAYRSKKASSDQRLLHSQTILYTGSPT